MTIKREWVTPLTIGAFLLSAVTGILIFFHLDTGLNKAAHEWLGWALVGGVALHAVVNFNGFKRHFGTGVGKTVIGLFALLLVLSFAPLGEDKDGPPTMVPARALANAPIATLAVVARVTPEQMMERVKASGLQPESAQQSLGELVGKDMHRQIEVLAELLREAG
jgi:peptidoglycan/LPS O-acetylase OafA/YrhL